MTSIRLYSAAVAVILGTAWFGVSPAIAAESPDATPVERARAYVEPSIVLVASESSGYVYDKSVDDFIGTEKGGPRVFETGGGCTGFVVGSSGLIATAGHCVYSRGAQDEIKLAAMQWAVEHEYYEGNYSAEELVISQQLEVQDFENNRGLESHDVFVAWGQPTGDVEAEEAVRARVLSAQAFDKGDAALLKVDVKGALAVPLSDGVAEVGNPIVAVGYPEAVSQVTDFSFDASYLDGSVSKVATTEEGLFKTYEVSASVDKGMSGGPVANSKGEAIAFNDYKNADPGKDDFNFARPSSLLLELIADEGTENELDASSKAYRAGLDAYFAGDRERAIEQLTKAAKANEDNKTVESFLTKAQKLEKDFNWVLAIVGAFAAIAILGALAFLLMKRRSKKAGGEDGPSPSEMKNEPALVTSEPSAASTATSASTSNSDVASPPSSIVQELKDLAELRDQGILTDEQFEAKKTQILGL